MTAICREGAHIDWTEIMKARHSVRRFTEEPLREEAIAAIRAEIDARNQKSGLHMQLIPDEPEAFQAEKSHYGSFEGCKNYLAGSCSGLRQGWLCVGIGT